MGVRAAVPWDSATPASAPCLGQSPCGWLQWESGQPHGTGMLLHTDVTGILLCVPIAGQILLVPVTCILLHLPVTGMLLRVPIAVVLLCVPISGLLLRRLVLAGHIPPGHHPSSPQQEQRRC